MVKVTTSAAADPASVDSVAEPPVGATAGAQAARTEPTVINPTPATVRVRNSRLDKLVDLFIFMPLLKND
jgi:hypothetical protein